MNIVAEAFIKLSYRLTASPAEPALEEAMQKQYHSNKWFTPFFIRQAIDAIAEMINIHAVEHFLARYEDKSYYNFNRNKEVAVISAGNIPLAAFYDFLCVLITGNRYVGKLSEHDKWLLPALAEMLIDIEPSLKDKIRFVDRLTRFDKIIATGSDNSARYFDYYFGRYPHIFRKNKNSAAILTGFETEAMLALLCDDMFRYFGLGCRSVSKLFVPTGYDFKPLLEAIVANSAAIADQHCYLNNLEYQKTMYLMNQYPFMDAGPVMLVESEKLSSPIAIEYYQHYADKKALQQMIDKEKEHLQCVVGDTSRLQEVIDFGRAQRPSLLDFPDKIDVIEFLCN